MKEADPWKKYRQPEQQMTNLARFDITRIKGLPLKERLEETLVAYTDPSVTDYERDEVEFLLPGTIFSNPSLTASYIDFEHKEAWERTATLLDLIDRAHWEEMSEHSDPEFEGDVAHAVNTLTDIEETVTQALKNGQGNWLLRARAKELLERIRLNPHAWDEPEGKEEPQKKMVKSRSNINDFDFLMNKETLKAVEKEFGINISNLSVNEQYWLLQMLKTRDMTEIEPVKEFVKQYGSSGLRTFLALDYGKELGDKIVEIGLENPEKLAGEVFDRYASLIDKSESLRAKMSEALNKESENLGEFANYIQEAFLRRAKDLLLASGKDVKGVLKAMDGLHLFLRIAGDLNVGESYSWEVQESGDPQVKRYRVQDETSAYILRVSTRPEQNSAGQARINFELDFDTDRPNIAMQEAFKQVNEYPQAKELRKQRKEESVLRIGLDLDNRNGKSEVSLDFGRSKFEGEKIKRSGDVLGNLLALSGTNHTPESFPPEFSSPEKFKQIVLSFEAYLHEPTYIQKVA